MINIYSKLSANPGLKQGSSSNINKIQRDMGKKFIQVFLILVTGSIIITFIYVQLMESITM